MKLSRGTKTWSIDKHLRTILIIQTIDKIFEDHSNPRNLLFMDFIRSLKHLLEKKKKKKKKKKKGKKKKKTPRQRKRQNRYPSQITGEHDQ